jgi:hypothetical protein
LQGTQGRHTKANLAKEPALFPRFRDTPSHGGDRNSIQITKTKGEHITWSAAMLADEYILSFISLSARIQPTEFYQFLLLSSSLVFQSAAAPGWTLKNTSTAASSGRCTNISLTPDNNHFPSPTFYFTLNKKL